MNTRIRWTGASVLRRRQAKFARWGGCMAGLCLAISASGAEAPSFKDLVAQAVRLSPRFREIDAITDSADGRATQASAWPNPVAGVDLEDVAGTGLYRGTAQSQTTLTISEPIELGGQRAARMAAGRANVSEARARGVELRADFGYELALAFAGAEAAQVRIDLLRQDAKRVAEDRRIARALVAAGKEGELRVVQVDAAAASADAELVAAQADQVASLSRLGSLVGADTDYQGVKPSLLVSGYAVRDGHYGDPGDKSPAVQTAQAASETAERQATVEQKRAIPTPSISVGVRRIAGDAATVWVAGFSIPIPLFDRNRGAISAARADIRAAQARLEAAKLEAAAQRRAADAQTAAANSRLDATERGETAAGEAYRLARIGYEAGRTPLIELLSTRRALTDAQLRALEARVARVQAEASLARLAGRIPFIE